MHIGGMSPNIFNPLDTDTNIEDCNQNDRLKKFWYYMKNLRNDSTGVFEN